MRKLIVIALVGLLSIVAGFFNLKRMSADTVTPTATISLSTPAGSFVAGSEFEVNLVVDGGGQNFTSFSANVETTNLTVSNMTLGPVSKWTKEPNASSLSFFGAVVGQTNNIVVYTMKVKGNNAGPASISVTQGSVKQTDGYTIIEILASQSGGNYTISVPPDPINPDPPAPGPTPPPSPTPPPAPAPLTPEKQKSVVQTDQQSLEKRPVKTQENRITTVNQTTDNITAPVMPTSFNEFLKEWNKIAKTNDLKVSVGKANTAKFDMEHKTLSGLTFYGNAKPNTLVTLYIYSNQIIGSAKTSSEGSWSVTIYDPLSVGLHSVYAIQSSANNALSAPNNETKFNISNDGQKVDMLVGGHNFGSAKLFSILLIVVGLILVNVAIYLSIKRKRKEEYE